MTFERFLLTRTGRPRVSPVTIAGESVVVTDGPAGVQLAVTTRKAADEAKSVASRLGVPIAFLSEPAPLPAAQVASKPTPKVADGGTYWRRSLARAARPFGVSAKDLDGITEATARNLLGFAANSVRDNLSKRGQPKAGSALTKEDDHG